MQINQEIIKLMTQTSGIEPLTLKEGFAAFERALTFNNPEIIVLKGNERKFEQKLISSVFLSAEKLEIAVPEHKEAKNLLNELNSFLLQKIASQLKIKIQDLNPFQELSHYGMDSIGVITFTNTINDYLQINLTPAILFEHNTINSFGEYLLIHYKLKIAELFQTQILTTNINENINAHTDINVYKNADVLAKPPLNEASGSTIKNSILNHNLDSNARINANTVDHRIAIVGMAGVFPKAENVTEFWNNLINGIDGIEAIPNKRWAWENYSPKIKWGGFIKDIDLFDAGFFNISPREAQLTDPQQRIFLQTVWHAIEDSGYSIDELGQISTGVFVGVISNDYTELLQNRNISDAFTVASNSRSIIANRVSYVLNLKGPSEVIDTACSSSLVAIYHAIQSIISGDCEVAIAGGINAILTPTSHLATSAAGMLSEDGQCKTFDKNANGYVRAESSGAIVLKSLSKALNDGDTIYGIIRGAALNHGGHVSSLSVPNPNAQADVITKALNRAGCAPETISYIEAHGTGTSLGDPIEINGLKKVYGTTNEKYCGLGTVKSNIGHTESAAGIVSVIKILLALKYKLIPANLHFNELNPYIELEGSPFYIVSKNQKWEQPNLGGKETIPRRAGVSSFGFGGTNAHLIIEEPAPRMLQAKQTKPYYLITLSAKQNEILMHKKYLTCIYGCKITQAMLH